MKQEGGEGRQGGEEEEGVAGCETGRRRKGSGREGTEGGEADLVATICPG